MEELDFKKMFFLILTNWFFFFSFLLLFFFFFFYKGVHVTQKVQQVRQRVPANQVTHIFAWLRNKTTQSPRYPLNSVVLTLVVNLFQLDVPMKVLMLLRLDLLILVARKAMKLNLLTIKKILIYFLLSGKWTQHQQQVVVHLVVVHLVPVLNVVQPK